MLLCSISISYFSTFVDMLLIQYALCDSISVTMPFMYELMWHVIIIIIISILCIPVPHTFEIQIMCCTIKIRKAKI